MKTFRVIRHIRYTASMIYFLKYNILNDALDLNVNETNIFLFKKYSKRLHLLRM